MAESILFNVAGNLVTKLGSLALQELGLIWGVSDELEKLKSTVSSIEAVLLDAEEQKSKSNAVRDWLSKLKDAFYDADDLIDEFSYEVLRRQVRTKDRRKTKQVRIFFSRSNQIAFGLQMGHKLKEFRGKLDAIAADKTPFNFSEHARDSIRDDGLRERRYTHSFIREEEVVGRDNDKKVLMDHLMNINITENIPVIAIVGIGGLGKTALAQSVFNNEKITKFFELKLWVCISEEFDLKIMVEKIIESATGKKPKPLEMDLLQSKLRKEIDGKKYLLLLDDVWNRDYEKWVTVKRLLVGGAKGSKIAITTRDEQVANTCDASITYRLKGLSKRDSWSLFKQMAFNEGKEVKNPNLIKVGKDIAARLKGVPLAIRIIGRLLYYKKSEDDWLSFRDNELYTVMQEENEMQSILKLSYNHLSSNLKQCFTYCALFPKDYVMRKDELIKQWVAQGFAQPCGRNKPIEDVGDDYFMELLWSSFFQDVERNEWGDIIGCKMHDLMHDLACSITEKECLLVNVDGRPIDKRSRHISFRSNVKELPESIFEVNNLRSLLLEDGFPDSESDCYKPIVNKILGKFLNLRTLELGRCEIRKLPKCISKLKHLRYLDLSRNEGIEFLPNSITELYNLETLILRHCWRLRELPKDIKNLIHLRHLDLDDCCNLSCMPKGLGGMTTLLTLNLFVLAKDDGDGLKELNGLENLRGSLKVERLNFCKAVNLQKKDYYLSLKSGLIELNFEWLPWDWRGDDILDDDERVLECLQPHPNVRKIEIQGYGGIRLCKWLSSFDSLRHLVTIRLAFCERLMHLPQFDQFPSLKSLHLVHLKSVEYIDCSDDSHSSSIFFPSLEFLRLSSMPKLKGWWKWKGETSTEFTDQTLPTFPRLSELRIFGCSELINIPWHQPIRTLHLNDVGKQVLDTVINTTTGLAKKSSSPLFKLEDLELHKIKDIEFLPDELFCNRSTLYFLYIYDCDNLQLCFSSEDNDGELWKNLRRLRLLIIQGIPKLEYLPEGMQHLTTLRSIILRNCQNLKSLPEWIGNLTSLTDLTIDNCSNLSSLPEGMRYLSSLQSLKIERCPKLIERCEEGIGEDWPKITHIPKLKYS